MTERSSYGDDSMKASAGSAQGRVALVTGAAKRLGAAIATHLHGQGYRVVVHYRHSEADALRLCQSLNRCRNDSAAAFGADLLELEALGRLIDRAANRWGRLDALVNNASTFYPTPMGEVTGRQWDELLGSNLRAPFFSDSAGRSLVVRGGRQCGQHGGRACRPASSRACGVWYRQGRTGRADESLS